MANQKDQQSYQRKDAHLDLAKTPLAKAQISHPFDTIQLTHHALPDGAINKVQTTTLFCGKQLSVPFFIGAMTGGTKRADAINHALAEVAQDKQIALALGSQRAGLSRGLSQKSLRRIAPDAVLIGNLGITQLAAKEGQDMALRAIDDIEANAMAIHLNPLQEAAQIEGDHDWSGTRKALTTFLASCPVPVIIKEVGAGINAELAAELTAMGAAYIDIAGLGGTNWTRIETARHDTQNQTAFAPFLDWGIDTATAIQTARAAMPDGAIIASGGIRHGLDVAKALALGADLVCAAGPFLAALEDDNGTLSQQALASCLDEWTYQLNLACFLTNCRHSRDLSQKSRPYVTDFR
ncbi:MAG: type 2 isopentenyl-diphosphate Delta-isomerase [Candidatus Puniceispirillaceae bacterium]